MADYYSYLWSTTWPSVVIGLLLFFFVAARIGWKIGRTVKGRRTFWSVSWLSWRSIVWIGVLLIYGATFFALHKDWYYKPFYFTGMIGEKYITQGHNRLKINQGDKQVEVTVDENAYARLIVGDYVQIMYLPIRQEVVKCQVIDPPGKTD